MKLIDLKGRSFGRLEVQKRVENDKRGYPQWLCLCICRNIKVVSGENLRSGKTSSCGCYWLECVRKSATSHGKSCTIEYDMYRAAKCRAKRAGLVFNIALEDIVIPEICPVFGTPFIKGSWKNHAYSPSLDRIETSKGYEPGNVWVISHRANLIKNDASLGELKLLVTALKEVLNEQEGIK